MRSGKGSQTDVRGTLFDGNRNRSSLRYFGLLKRSTLWDTSLKSSGGPRSKRSLRSSRPTDLNLRRQDPDFP